MAEILCGTEPAAAAAVSEVKPPIVRATRRRRRMEYARTYDENQEKRISREEAAMASPVAGEQRVDGQKLGPGSGVEEGDGVLLLHPHLQSLEHGSSLREPRCHAPLAAPGYGMASVRGRRRDMEDAVSIRPDLLLHPGFHFYGIFDGHGCSHVAISCNHRMHELVYEELAMKPIDDEDIGSDWDGVMARVFARMDTEVLLAGRNPGELSCGCGLQAASKCDHVGSTAVVAVVTADRVVVANCGDSRAVMCRKGVPLPLSDDHKPDRPDELQRIQAAGGRVIYWDGARVLGVLAMSRAIGDNHLKPFVTSEPEVTVTPRTANDEFLILASDGLWDVVSNVTACQVVRMCLKRRAGTRLSSPPPSPLLPPNGGSVSSSPTVVADAGEDRQAGSDKACQEAAVLLTRLALARRSADNVSVVVVDLRKANR